jgi:hypothetical protein
MKSYKQTTCKCNKLQKILLGILCTIDTLSDLVEKMVGSIGFDKGSVVTSQCIELHGSKVWNEPWLNKCSLI